MDIQNICYNFEKSRIYVKKLSKKVEGCQNIVCYKDRLWSKACRLRPVHCIRLLFYGLPFCRNIHTAAEGGYNHSNPAGQIHRNVHFWVCSAQFRTSRRQYDNFHAPENVFRFHSIIQLLASQNSYCAGARLMRTVPGPAGNNSWRRQSMPQSCFRPIPARMEGIAPEQKRLLHIVCDSIIHARNNTAGVDRETFLLRALFCKCSDSDPDLPQLFFCGRLQYPSK